MNRTSRELKSTARGNLLSGFLIPVQAFLISFFLPLVLQYPFSLIQTNRISLFQQIINLIVSILIAMISTVFLTGQIRIHLAIARKKEFAVRNVWDGFRNHPDYILVISFIRLFFYALAFIPTFIGIYFYKQNNDLPHILMLVAVILVSVLLYFLLSLEFHFVFYLLADNPGQGIRVCLKTSFQLIRPRRKKLLYLIFSFLGMDILTVLSLGIGSIWITPYRLQTYTLFYLDSLSLRPELMNK